MAHPACVCTTHRFLFGVFRRNLRRSLVVAMPSDVRTYFEPMYGSTRLRMTCTTHRSWQSSTWTRVKALNLSYEVRKKQTRIVRFDSTFMCLLKFSSTVWAKEACFTACWLGLIVCWLGLRSPDSRFVLRLGATPASLKASNMYFCLFFLFFFRLPQLVSFVLIGVLVLLQTRGFLVTITTVSRAFIISG